jgi:hypothetical protein
VKRAVSKIGKLAYRMSLRDEDILIAIRAFLDGSGKFTDDYVTLAAFAGNDDIWAEFETEWDRILTGHTPRADYIHMRELVRQIDGFDWRHGWNVTNSFGLVTKCLMYMQHLDKKRFRMFYCAVDLAAWRKLKAETYELPEPIELCNRFCSELVLGWYFVKHPDILDPMNGAIHYFFDKDEPYKQVFEDKWKSETGKIDASKGDWSVWNLVKEVAAVEMRKVPGIQAADILAWSVNRENTSIEGSPGRMLLYIMQQVIPSGFIVWDEERMRQHFRPTIYKP